MDSFIFYVPILISKIWNFCCCGYSEASKSCFLIHSHYCNLFLVFIVFTLSVHYNSLFFFFWKLNYDNILIFTIAIILDYMALFFGFCFFFLLYDEYNLEYIITRFFYSFFPFSLVVSKWSRKLSLIFLENYYFSFCSL